MEGFNLSEYFKTTQSNIATENSNSDMNNAQAFYNGTQVVTDTNTVIKDEFIDKFVSYSNLILGVFGAFGHILSLIIFRTPHSVTCHTRLFVPHWLWLI